MSMTDGGVSGEAPQPGHSLAANAAPQSTVRAGNAWPCDQLPRADGRRTYGKVSCTIYAASHQRKLPAAAVQAWHRSRFQGPHWLSHQWFQSPHCGMAPITSRGRSRMTPGRLVKDSAGEHRAGPGRSICERDNFAAHRSWAWGGYWEGSSTVHARGKSRAAYSG